MNSCKYRIFISSVQKELEVERVSVAGEVSSDNILNAFCDIVLFEKEPLSGKKVAKPYLKCLESCLVASDLAEEIGKGRSVKYIYKLRNR